MTNSRTAANRALSNGINATGNDTTTVKEFTTFSKDIYKRMNNYIRSKGLSKTQDLTRLAVSYFLDKEGF